MKTPKHLRVAKTLAAFSLALTAGLPSAMAAEKALDGPQKESDRSAPSKQESSYGRTEKLGKINKASGVIGMEVRNPQGEKLGRIDDLIIDMQSGRVICGVLSSGGFLGIGDKLIAIPATAFEVSTEDKKLVVNTTRQKLEAAPSFERNKWPDAADTAWITEAYRYHGGEPYWVKDSERVQLRDEGPAGRRPLDNERERLGNARDSVTEDYKDSLQQDGAAADNTRRNERDRDRNTLTPADQGNSEADREITRKIRRAIVTEKTPEAFSLYAKNVKIITVNGVVTLRGVVKTAAEKDAIEATAKEVTGVSKVDNQLDVKNP